MDGKSILLLVVVIFLIIFLVRYITKDVNTLTGVTEATTMQKIEADDLDTSSSSGNTSNFTYSIWFYIDDWNYRYGEPKIIFGRMTPGNGERDPCPSVVLAPTQNNIIISQTVFSGDEETESDENFAIHTCGIANVPIQRWVNLLTSVYGRSMDIYLDGKLVKTCILPGVAKIDQNAPVFITPNGGFSGWTSRFQFWPDSTDPQKAWNIYKAGYGGSSLGSMFGDYTIKISLMEGDTEQSTYTI